MWGADYAECLSLTMRTLLETPLECALEIVLLKTLGCSPLTERAEGASGARAGGPGPDLPVTWAGEGDAAVRLAT